MPKRKNSKQNLLNESLTKVAQEVYKDLDFDYNSYIQNNQGESMNKAEELRTIELAQEGSQRAQMAILDKYERLCHKLARKYGFAAPSYQHEDLVQEGRIGLLKAIQTYSKDNGASFMTWAFYHVRGAIAGCGRVDSKQPRYPKSIEDAARQYNLEDPTQEIEVRDDVSTELIKKIITECCGGLHTKRANIVMDRFGLLGRKELRNCECAQKYGMTKYAVNSHCYNFKKKARDKFADLENFI